MPIDADDLFYERADAHIHLSNDQLSTVSLGAVSASMLYGTARFNAWVSARGFNNGSEMQLKRKKTIDYFVAKYIKMLNENLDDYIKNFDRYMKPG